MKQPLTGKIRTITVTTAAVGAGSTVANLRPEEGKIWNIVWCRCYQVSGGARTLAWNFVDPDSTILLSNGSVADWVPLNLGAVDTYQQWAHGNWWATYTRYPQADLTATGAGDDVYIKAVVIEYSGANAV